MHSFLNKIKVGDGFMYSNYLTESWRMNSNLILISLMDIFIINNLNFSPIVQVQTSKSFKCLKTYISYFSIMNTYLCN